MKPQTDTPLNEVNESCPDFDSKKQQIEDEIVKFLGDQDAQDLQSQHIDDLNDKWNETVAEQHFAKAGFKLSIDSFKNVHCGYELRIMFQDEACLERISRHPFEWLNQKQIIRLFNVLRAVDPSIKLPHEVSKNGIRFNILEWMHIYNLIIEYKKSNELNTKLQVNRMELEGLFAVRFAELENLKVSQELVHQFAYAQANSDKKNQFFKKSVWGLVGLAFVLRGLDVFLGANIPLQILSLLCFVSAIALFFYTKKIYPKRFLTQGRHEMICEKLVMQSY